jgi:hypothetical protein
LGEASSRSKWGQWRLRLMINNFYIEDFYAFSSNVAGACTYDSDDTSRGSVFWRLICYFRRLQSWRIESGFPGLTVTGSRNKPRHWRLPHTINIFISINSF